MKPASFVYHRAPSVEAAVALLQEHGTEASLLAGGQSLIPLMNLRLARPAVLVDIGQVRGLSHAVESGAGLRVGALARHSQLAALSWLAPPFDVVARVAPLIGHEPIRNVGTIGGSIAHADPQAEWCTLALALDASVVLQGAKEIRSVRLEDFLVGPYQTSRREDEVVIELVFATPATCAGFKEFSRRSGDFALVSSAVALQVDDHGYCRDARVVVSGLTAGPTRRADAEAHLKGSTLDDAVLEAAATATGAGDQVRSDRHASVRVRRALAKELTLDALREALR